MWLNDYCVLIFQKESQHCLSKVNGYCKPIITPRERQENLYQHPEKLKVKMSYGLLKMELLCLIHYSFNQSSVY